MDSTTAGHRPHTRYAVPSRPQSIRDASTEHRTGWRADRGCPSPTCARRGSRSCARSASRNPGAGAACEFALKQLLLQLRRRM
eukprot:3022754-Rhodomonas_salina.1